MLYDKEDISTIGGEWENEGSQQTASITRDENSVGMGDLDDDDIAADKAQYYKDNAMIVDGFECPGEYLTIIAPMEFEEIVNLFLKFDTDKSGTIDKHECKKILNFLGFDYSLEKAEELLKLIDTDGNGSIDFAEFCHFFVMMKRGDERVAKFSSLMDKLHSTPLGELERQAQYRDLTVKFKVVEVREASLTNPTLFVVEVDLAGIWRQIVDGEITANYAIKRFQGLGDNVREAKYAAANSALMNLGSAMPGNRTNKLKSLFLFFVCNIYFCFSERN
jgi:hypothetical protein